MGNVIKLMIEAIKLDGNVVKLTIEAIKLDGKVIKLDGEVTIVSRCKVATHETWQRFFRNRP